MSKSIAKNILAKGTLNVFNILLPLLVTPYVYRVLGPSGIGSVEYSNTLYAYFGMLGLLGIYNYGLREISANRNNPTKVREIYKNLFVIQIFSNLIVLGCYVLFILFCIKDPILRTISFILCGNLISQLFYVEWMNEAFEEFQFITIKTVIVRVLSTVAIFLLIKSSGDILRYVSILVITLFVNYSISFIYAYNRNIRIPLRDLFKRLSPGHYIVPLLFILLLNNTGILYTVVDRTMLGYYVGTDSVAMFSIGQKIVEIAKTLLLSIIFATLPRMSLYLRENKQLYEEGIIKIMHLTLMLVIPASIGLFMLSEQVILIFGGSQYLPAVPSMRIFSLRILLLSIEAVLYNQIIFLHRKEKVLIVFNLICGGLNIILNFIFIKYFSPLVAISTTLCAEIVFESLCIWYIKKNMDLKLGIMEKYVARYLFASLLFIPIIIIIKAVLDSTILRVLCSIVICGGLYTIILFVFGKNDKILVDVRCYISNFFSRNRLKKLIE